MAAALSTRRAALAAIAVAPVVAVIAPMPVIAATSWDVEDWAGRFKAVGGFIAPNSCGWQIHGRTDEERSEARRLFNEMDADPARRDALHEFANSPSEIKRWLSTFEKED